MSELESAERLDPVREFRALHESGCFLLPNPWDVGSAVFLQHAGYRALASTSAGLAFSLGLPDHPDALPKQAVLSNIKSLVEATPLPVNADFQSGYGATLEQLHESVVQCVGTGAAGLSIEDATGDPKAPLFQSDTALERVRTARAAIDSTGTAVVLTARCEAWLVGAEDADRTVMDRLVAFADAGADCLYAPGVRDPKKIQELVKAVSPKPLNVLMSQPGGGLTVPLLTDLGVRRISVGSALCRVAWGAFVRAAAAILKDGSFDSLEGAAPFADLNRVFEARR